MDTKKQIYTKSADRISKMSLAVSVISLALVPLLSVRVEFVYMKARTMETKLENRIQRTEDVLQGKLQKMVEAMLQSDETPTTRKTKERNNIIFATEKTNTKFRRSLTPANRSLTIDDIRSEITKQVSKLKPISLCQPSEKVCVPGPPGKKGSRGPRGKRGPQGQKGKRGEQGIMGLTGRHGKQGITGDKGEKGEKGGKGVSGPRGMTGQKGEPGDTASSPFVTISPETQTVTENQTARFYCSARGHPKPAVTWSKVNDSRLARRVIANRNGRLEVTKSKFNDSGEYICSAVSILGRDSKTAKLFVEVGPQLTKVPDRFLLIDEGSEAVITCEAFSHPPSVVTWKRVLVALPKGRSTVQNGTLKIQDFSIADSGMYVCTATNKLGSVSAVTTLGFQRKPTSCQKIVSKHSRKFTGIYGLTINSFKFEIYCHIENFQGWTLIARFSNSDTKNWMRDDGSWWYDQQVAMGTTNNPSVNADMISPAFWLVSGREFKITRSDDPSHTPLLQTTGNCLAGQTFRSKITSYGDFRNGKVWASDQCLGSCTVQYGGQYKSTDGFQQAECSGNIQSANKIGFWCDWSTGDGSVLMIGGGGSNCERADHGIGITEANAASFVQQDETNIKYDFGYDAMVKNAPTNSYSLNLWIR